MRVVIQRVSHASVTIEAQIRSSIRDGLVVLVGIEDADTTDDAAWLGAKIVNLRIFNDEERRDEPLGEGNRRRYLVDQPVYAARVYEEG